MLQRTAKGVGTPAGDTSSTSTSVAASATAHVKGAWTQLIAATTQTGGQLLINLGTDVGVAAAQHEMLMDVGIGASGSETVILSNVNLSGWQANNYVIVPIRIADGTRVSARVQANTGSKAVNLHALVLPVSTPDVPDVWDTYGAVTASSRGTVLPAVTTTGTKTAYTQITASTTRPAHWVAMSVGMPPSTNIPAVALAFDIAVGASGSEQILIQNMRWNFTAGEIVRGSTFSFPTNLPAGQRLSVRYTSNLTTATHTPTVCLHTAA